jgi:RNA polymerase sigma factor (TIGR02999 family)
MEEAITWDHVHALMDELRAMARALLALEGNAQSLQPTALILTALWRQKPSGVDWNEVTWPNRTYFFGAMYRAMWQALIDHARKRMGKKYARPVQVEQLHLENLVQTADEHPEQILALKLALKGLRAKQPEWAELVEHRYISGYTVKETARVIGISERTIRRRWEKEWERVRLVVYKEVLRILNEEDITLADVEEASRSSRTLTAEDHGEVRR